MRRGALFWLRACTCCTRVSLGNAAAARGSLARAARIVEEAGLGSLAGWVALLRAHDSDDATAAKRWPREARESATGIDDPDLELCAVSQLGASLLQGANGTRTASPYRADSRK